MSVFKVFHGGTANYDQQFEGTKIAAREFHNYWTSSGGGQKIFQNFIIGLIEDHNCIVTYKDDSKIVFVKTTGGAKHLFYTQGGQDRQIHPKAEKDNPNNDVVSMAVPSLAVEPEEPNTAAYLNAAIGKISDPNIADSDKRAFLLGLLLLKRCR